MRLLHFNCSYRLPHLPVSVRESAEGISLETGDLRRRREKVIVVLGATGTGKSRLSIDLAKHFPAEVINADKMQVYEGLDTVTNKVTVQEQRGVTHHLLGVADPDGEFSASDFRALASASIDSIVRRRRLPIIAGGSNSYIEALVSDEASRFRLRYDCCFLWVDAAMPVLHTFLTDRVDRMVEAGLVEEVRKMFHPKADYTLGLRKAIGVPEMDQYLRALFSGAADDRTLAALLEAGIHDIKANTCKLSCCQVGKIHRLRAVYGWDLHRLDATEALASSGRASRDAWDRQVARPSVGIVTRFLLKNYVHSGLVGAGAGAAVAAAAAAAAAGAVEAAAAIG
ncbi:Adenylate isopentenyltransferase 5 [Nymphaea thermarum]|nr:Adenylate isopentenyltransferase 5 [Nymphaea thermarum]